MPMTDETEELEAIARRGHNIDVSTARFAVRDAIAATAHLTRLRADSPGMDELIDAILINLSQSDLAWAIEGIIADKRDMRAAAGLIAGSEPRSKKPT